MGTKRTLPPAATKCGCGHAFHEHVQGGDQHACQHGAQPPFTQMCPCKKFRTKEEERANADLKRQSRRDRAKKRKAASPETPAAPVAAQDAAAEATPSSEIPPTEAAGERPTE